MTSTPWPHPSDSSWKPLLSFFIVQHFQMTETLGRRSNNQVIKRYLQHSLTVCLIKPFDTVLTDVFSLLLVAILKRRLEMGGRKFFNFLVRHGRCDMFSWFKESVYAPCVYIALKTMDLDFRVWVSWVCILLSSFFSIIEAIEWIVSLSSYKE